MARLVCGTGLQEWVGLARKSGWGWLARVGGAGSQEWVGLEHKSGWGWLATVGVHNSANQVFSEQHLNT